MNEKRASGGKWLKALIANGIAVGIALTMPIGTAAADPIDDYMDRVNKLVGQFSGEDPSGRISAEDFNSMLNVENNRLIETLIATKLPR